MSRLGYSPLTGKVYLIKANGQREDWTQHFMGFCDESLPLPRAAKEAIADALRLKLPPEADVAEPKDGRSYGGKGGSGLRRLD